MYIHMPLSLRTQSLQKMHYALRRKNAERKINLINEILRNYLLFQFFVSLKLNMYSRQNMCHVIFSYIWSVTA